MWKIEVKHTMSRISLKKYIYPLLGILILAYCIKEAMGNGDFTFLTASISFATVKLMDGCG